MLFGVLTVGAIGSTIQAAANADTAGARTGYGISSGVMDGALHVLIIALLILATRACHRRSTGGKQSIAPGSDRRPWEH
ncbi:hypothetical protein ACFWOT_32395 [Streptomyces sp. NPDC058440]|uniref:hypothetical protein n=1 Tax=Streptomyces sp. NPDC058440 TaxID=3346501 RepID=UPI00365BDD0C